MPPAVANGSAKVRFGPFEADLLTQELHNSGKRIRVPAQSFQVLKLLLNHPGDLVTREQLRSLLWPADTFGDFEHGLNAALNRLRDALHDSADHPRWIETLPKRGYRFIGKIRPEPPVALTIPEAQESVELVPVPAATAWSGRRWTLGAAAVLIAGLAADAFLHLRAKLPDGPARISQISRWNKPMNDAKLPPDGHAVAFVSPVGGIAQVFLMLTSGGEPLQLTNDEGDKFVNAFSPDGKEVYYARFLGRDEVWAVPTLGGAPRRPVVSAYSVVPSPDGAFIYYWKSGSAGIFRTGKSGLNEELVYNPEGSGMSFIPLLLFPGGSDLLASAGQMYSPNFRFYRINMTSHKAVDLGDVSGNDDVAWEEPGNTVLFSQNVNGLTNIWRYNLKDQSLTQITFGAGPDFSPMPDPEGKGVYYVNGKSSGFLTAYDVHSKESKDIASEDATQPIISPDGKRVMYITLPARDRSELWVSDIDGGNKVKIARGEILGTGTWAQDNFHLSFDESGASAEDKAYIVGADGSGLRQLLRTKNSI